MGEHIPGVENGTAEALPRDNVLQFHAQVPQASSTRAPGSVPGPGRERTMDWIALAAQDYFSRGLAK